MKKDFLVVILIVGIVMGGGYYVHSHTNIAYSSGNSVEKDKEVEIKSAVERALNVTNLDDSYVEVPIKEEEYTIDEVYASILAKDEEANGVSDELLNIYNDFYKYFNYSNNFINKYNENYTYYEYNYVKNNYNLEGNFGKYIVHNKKCDVYSNLFNDNRYC